MSVCTAFIFMYKASGSACVTNRQNCTLSVIVKMNPVIVTGGGSLVRYYNLLGLHDEMCELCKGLAETFQMHQTASLSASIAEKFGFKFGILHLQHQIKIKRRPINQSNPVSMVRPYFVTVTTVLWTLPITDLSRLEWNGRLHVYPADIMLEIGPTEEVGREIKSGWSDKRVYRYYKRRHYDVQVHDTNLFHYDCTDALKEAEAKAGNQNLVLGQFWH